MHLAWVQRVHKLVDLFYNAVFLSPKIHARWELSVLWKRKDSLEIRYDAEGPNTTLVLEKNHISQNSH